MFRGPLSKSEIMQVARPRNDRFAFHAKQLCAADAESVCSTIKYFFPFFFGKERFLIYRAKLMLCISVSKSKRKNRYRSKRCLTTLEEEGERRRERSLERERGEGVRRKVRKKPQIFVQKKKREKTWKCRPFRVPCAHRNVAGITLRSGRSPGDLL